MRILIVKMTSLGDVVHMLPALTEAAACIPNLSADWVVEDAFAILPAWHPAVARVLPVALRRWRKRPFDATVRAEFGAFRQQLREARYDLILDSQGLLKSAAIALLAQGPRAGLDRASAREPLASLTYARRYRAPRALHAITRNRLLTAQALGYAPGAEADIRYGVAPPATEAGLPARYLVALHGTARAEKEYPEAAWLDLLARLDLPVLLPWGNDAEKARAERLAARLPNVRVLPRLDLAQLGGILAGARAVIGVDTGLMHLAAAFRRPGVGLYPATPPERFGARAEPDAPALINLADPAAIAPARVAETLAHLLDSA
ncbi:MAG: lipopolysaccharide heptosyltransferase I [Betaproteobacteria bacterium]|nr:lipopolysaccharide heptosyltransferase I [Betaproteobacteria bacterium]